MERLAGQVGVPAYDAGSVKALDGTVELRLRDTVISQAVARLREVYFTAIPKRMGD